MQLPLYLLTAQKNCDVTSKPTVFEQTNDFFQQTIQFKPKKIQFQILKTQSPTPGQRGGKLIRFNIKASSISCKKTCLGEKSLIPD